jgi:hypothetical protein
MSLEEVWNSPGNTPGAAASSAFVRDAFDRLRRYRRRRIALVVWTAVVLGGFTVLAVRSRAEGGWGLGLILAAQWMVLLYWVRQLLHSSQAGRTPSSIRAGVATLLRETEGERRGNVALLVLFAVVAPLLWVALRGLQEAGKMAPHEAASAGAVFAVVLGLGLARILYRLFGTVLPRQRRLETLAAEYAGDPSDASRT